MTDRAGALDFPCRSLLDFHACNRRHAPALHPPRDAHPNKAKQSQTFQSHVSPPSLSPYREPARVLPYYGGTRTRLVAVVVVSLPFPSHGHRLSFPPLQAHAVGRRARSPPPNHPTRRQFRNEPATTRPHTRLCSFFDAHAPCCRRGRSGRCRCRRGGCGCRGWARTGARLRRRGRWRSRGGGRRCSGCCTASPSPSTSSPSPTSSRRPRPPGPATTPAWPIRFRCRRRRRRRARGRRRASLARWGGRPGCPSPAGRPSSSRRWHRRGAPRGGGATAGAGAGGAASAAAATACCSTSTCPAPSPAASPRRAPALAPARPPSPTPPPSSSPRTPTRGRETATPSSAG